MVAVGDGRVVLPAFPTREEVAEFCNRGVARSAPITAETVRRWERMGYIRPHPAMRRPVRYDAREIEAFLGAGRGR